MQVRLLPPLTYSEDYMDPKLISAAARLCGWKKTDPIWSDSHDYYISAEHMRDEEWVVLGMHITYAGLLALEDALWRKKWYSRWNGEYIWQKHPAMRRTPVAHMDRAIAACLAAQQ